MTVPVYQSNNSTTGTGASSASIAPPTGTVSGNLLFLEVAVLGNVTITTPSGYTKIDEVVTGSASSTDVRTAIYYKVAGASESNLSVSFSGSTQHVVLWLRISGQTTSTIINTYSKNNGTAVTNTFTGITTSTADCLLIAVEAIFTSTGVSWTTPSTYTAINSRGSTNLGLTADRKDFTGPGATGNATSSWTSETNGDPWATFLVAIGSVEPSLTPGSLALCGVGR